MLLCIGANDKTAPMEVREKLAVSDAQLPAVLQELTSRYGCEAVVLSTCNRVEVYVARPESTIPFDAGLLVEFLAEFHSLAAEELKPILYFHNEAATALHLFHVVCGLDSLVLGESQIAGQVHHAYELAQQTQAVGPQLHALFQHARRVSKRVRTETGVAQGKVSVSSLAVDYVTEVFSRFDDKTILVIGAGKMGELTLNHLRRLRPKRILVTNRSPEKTQEVAEGCGGLPVPFDQLDRALSKADIILSTTGSTTPIVTLERFEQIAPKRSGRHAIIIDIAVPRDFDPRIGDLDIVDLLVNVDDLKQVRERILQGRMKHVPEAEALIHAECDRFFKEWSRRRTGPAIAKLSQDLDAIRRQVQEECFRKLNGKLSTADQTVIEGAFQLMQNRFLHSPIRVLGESSHEESGRGLLEAIYKLFRLHD